MDKPYTTYEEQVKILDNKKLIIKEKERVIYLLKKCGYFGLITGYKHPFKGKDGNYKKHTTIDDIYALYQYDMELRELFLRYILVIENKLKSLISYSFCEKYGDLESDYLNVTNFDYISSKQEDINKLIGKLQRAMNSSEKHPYVQHQRERHGNIPLWALMRVLTLGMVSKMYSLLKSEAQALVSKEFESVREDELTQMVDLLSRFRNVCAHNERLYDYKYLMGEIKTTNVHRSLNLKKKGDYYEQGKKDLFAVAIVFKYLLDKDEFDTFIDRFDELTNRLLEDTRIIQKAQILKLMGFPENWKEIKDCAKCSA